ncbi:MAG: Nif3-like dinuclear metal center hexameric protein, partial [Parachlamydiaceae bacterium]|nr:Nif3-like dinuclear metal center hexameric protein [Parachlamydiaceae bacterium]
KDKIFRVATGVTANLATIKKAIECKADALIVHHGLFWNKDDYCIQGVKREKIKLLLENNLSLFAYHFPMDKHEEIGNNWRAARELGWTQLEPFGFYNGNFIGVKGIIDPTSPQELKKKLENYYTHHATTAFGGPEVITKIALISGGSHKSLVEGARHGLDAFITGSFDEPNWYQAEEEKINFFAMGHSATERIGPKALAEHLQKSLNIPCEFIDVYNPF